MGDNHVGLQARLMSQALRKMTGGLSASGTTAIFINQLREKIGVMFGSSNGLVNQRGYLPFHLQFQHVEQEPQPSR